MFLNTIEYLKILTLSIVCVVAYGIANDQITARILLEFFQIFGLNIEDMSPTAVAFLFGIMATWWVGLLLGIPLSFAARYGIRPKATARDLLHPILVVLFIVASLAGIAGIIVWLLQLKPVLPPQILQYVPQEKANQFMIVNTIHIIGYIGGLIGGIILIITTYISREKMDNYESKSHNEDQEKRARRFMEAAPRWLQALLFSLISVVIFLLYYYIPPGIITITMTVGIAAFLVWIIIDPVRRYTRLLSIVVGVWATAMAIPSVDGYLQTAGIKVAWNVGEGPEREFHIAFAIAVVVLVIADFLQRNVELLRRQ